MIHPKAIALLRIAATLPQPFSTQDVTALAPCKSSVCHHLHNWVERGWLAIVEPGGAYQAGHIVQRTFNRTPAFPDPDTLEASQNTKTVVQPEQSEYDRRYWEFRNSLNINPMPDDD